MKRDRSPQPIRDARLTWRCRELVDRLAIWSLATGALAIVVILAIAIPWAIEQIPRHGWGRDANLEVVVVVGLLVAVGLVVRGLVGSWDLRTLPRVDRAAGLLHVGHRRAFRLVELGEITVVPIELPREDKHGTYVSEYALVSSTVGELATRPRGFGPGELEPHARVLRALIAARTLPPS